MTKQLIDASPVTIGLVAAIAVVIICTVVTQAFAITFFFNCMTDIANEHGNLTLDDVHMCLYKEYGVYNKVLTFSSIRPELVAMVVTKPSELIATSY
jgi:hypothetical protein